MDLSSILKASTPKHRLLGLWAVAVVARVAYALIAPGFHARDDYFHVLAPALQWIDEPSWIWALSDTPGAGIRSHLLPRIVQGLVELSASFTPTVQLQTIGAALALWSSLAVPLSWPIVTRLTSNPRYQDLLGALLALHPVLIYGAPKLLIEVHCLPLIVGAVSLLILNKRYTQVFISGLMFGLGVYVRYQAITIAPLALVWLFLNSKEVTAKVLNISVVIAGAITGICLGGIYDLFTDGRFLGPIIQNIEVNLVPSAELTRSSPLSYLGLLIALSCPWVLHRMKWSSTLKSPLLLSLVVGISSFVLVHSATPHKEERFLYPILPFLLLVFGTLWLSIPEQFRRLRRSLLFFHLGLTGVLFSIHPQTGTRMALESVAQTDARVLVSLGPEVQEFYLRPKSLPILRNRKFTTAWLQEALKTTEEDQFFILSYQPQDASVVKTIQQNNLHCSNATNFSQNWADNLAYRLNPRHNLRRSPIITRQCRRQ